MSFIRKFMRNEKAATAIEYGLIAALIAIAVIVGARFIGQNLNGAFNAIATSLNNATAKTN